MIPSIASTYRISNSADPSTGTLEGEILFEELPASSTGNHVIKALRALHNQGVRTRSHWLRTLALNAALEHRALISAHKQSPKIMKKEFEHA